MDLQLSAVTQYVAQVTLLKNNEQKNHPKKLLLNCIESLI